MPYDSSNKIKKVIIITIGKTKKRLNAKVSLSIFEKLSPARSASTIVMKIDNIIFPLKSENTIEINVNRIAINIYKTNNKASM